MSRKIFTFFKQCLQKYSLREYQSQKPLKSGFFRFLQYEFVFLKNPLNLFFVFFQCVDFLNLPPNILWVIKTIH